MGTFYNLKAQKTIQKHRNHLRRLTVPNKAFVAGHPKLLNSSVSPLQRQFKYYYLAADNRKISFSPGYKTWEMLPSDTNFEVPANRNITDIFKIALQTWNIAFNLLAIIL